MVRDDQNDYADTFSSSLQTQILRISQIQETFHNKKTAKFEQKWTEVPIIELGHSLLRKRRKLYKLFVHTHEKKIVFFSN